jgi:class 3 adenylate cyclase
VHYLSMVRRMQLTAEPIVRHFSGTLIKFEADNCFAMFPDVQGAVRCARQLQSAFWQQNLDTPDELDIRIACGIDFGRILVVEDNDFFGNAVNRACKLGEDLAEAGEILLTEEAVAQLPHGHGWKLRPQRFEISGLEIGAFALGVA